MWQHNARNNEEPLAAIMLRCRRVQSSRCFTAAFVLLKALSVFRSREREPTLSRTNPLATQLLPTLSSSFFLLSHLYCSFFRTVRTRRIHCVRKWSVLFEAMGFSLAVWPGHMWPMRNETYCCQCSCTRGNNGGGWWMLHWNMKSINDGFLCNRLHNSLINY